MAAARLDKVMPDFEGKLHLKWRAFPLEVINDRPAPRHIVDQEWPLIAVQEPLSPCRSWPHEEYLRTTIRAYQAYASAYAQDPEKARVYDLKIRRGFSTRAGAWMRTRCSARWRKKRAWTAQECARTWNRAHTRGA